MEIRLLGPLEVRDGERSSRCRAGSSARYSPRWRSRRRGRVDRPTRRRPLGESAPASATGSLQNTVSALRKLLGRDVLVTQAPGYRLAVDRRRRRRHRFERLLAQAREPDPADRARLLGEALELWRGPALADLDEEEFARLEAARLDELRVAAQEERIDAELELGRHARSSASSSSSSPRIRCASGCAAS